MKRFLLIILLTGTLLAQDDRSYEVILHEHGDDGGVVVQQLAATYGAAVEKKQGKVVFRMSPAAAARMSAHPMVAGISTADGAAPQATTIWSAGPYAYDGAGNIKAVGTTEQFAYDEFGRLRMGTTRNGGKQEYTYDGFGNILTITTDDATNNTKLGVNPSTNRISEPFTNAVGNNAFGSYDDSGNMFLAGTDTFSYDALGMITDATVGGARRVYLYTPGDERIGTIEVTSGGARGDADWTIRDPNGRVLRRYAETNKYVRTWKQDYVYAGARLIASEVNTTAKRLRFFPDHLGSPRVITANGGVQVAAHDYYPFGREESPSSDGEAMKFTGHERDTATLDYMHARYYLPMWGRFLSVDPEMNIKEALHEPQLWNRYSYVTNNPLKFTDPDGRYRTFYKEKPMTGENLAMDENTPGVVKGAFYAQGALLAAGAAELGIAGLSKVALNLLLRWEIAKLGAGAATAEGLRRAANSSGPTVQVVTNLTQAPAEGRALSASVGQGAQALSNAARSGEGVRTFVAQIPQALIKGLEAAKLLSVSTTQMNGVQATEYRFAPGAAEYIVRFFKEAK